MQPQQAAGGGGNGGGRHPPAYPLESTLVLFSPCARTTRAFRACFVVNATGAATRARLPAGRLLLVRALATTVQRGAVMASMVRGATSVCAASALRESD